MIGRVDLLNDLDLKALHLYLSYKHVPQPMSAKKGRIRTPIKVRCPKFYPHLSMEEDEIVDNMERLLKFEIVKITRDRPVYCALSGGIDSGLVTAIASKITSPEPIRTYSLVYSDYEGPGEKADREYSRQIAGMYGANHTEIFITFKDIWEQLPDILHTIGEPFSGYVTPWFLATHFVPESRIITGDWADELFGSYKAHRLAFIYPNTDPWLIRAQTFVFDDEEKRDLYSKEAAARIASFSTMEHLKGYFRKLTAEDPLNRMLESEFHSFYPDHTYLSFFKLTSGWDVQAISPYSQPDFADFAARIPGIIKMRGGETKYILKKLAERYLPREIVYRSKKGFVTSTLPLCISLEKDIRVKLSPDSLMKHNLFNIEYVENLVDDFYSYPDEKEVESYKVWNLVSLQVWGETCGLW